MITGNKYVEDKQEPIPVILLIYAVLKAGIQVLQRSVI